MGLCAALQWFWYPFPIHLFALALASDTTGMGSRRPELTLFHPKLLCCFP